MLQISGPGLESATVNHSTHILVHLANSSNEVKLNVTTQQPCLQQPTVDQPTELSPFRRKVSYTPASRGQHKLHVLVNDRDINGSPFTVMVYPDPRQLPRHPVSTLTGLDRPHCISFNTRNQMIVSELNSHRVSIFDAARTQRIGILGSCHDEPDQMTQPAGIATDDAGNMYVSSDHKLQKFTSSGELINWIGREGKGEREFSYPRGITLYNNLLYMCEEGNHRIQVFDVDLNFVQFIGSYGKGRGELNKPWDVKFDTAGNMYVADWGNRRIQVLDSSGGFIRLLGREEEGKLSRPSGLHIANNYVYVSDCRKNCILVYEISGQFLRSFGRPGNREGMFHYPYCITFCIDGFMYVCDHLNNRVQIF